MKKDNHKKVSTKRRLRLRLVLVILPFILFFVVTVQVYRTFFISHPTAHPPTAKASLGKIKTWYLARKTNFHEGVEQLKKLTSPPTDAAAQIHFEFYDALSNMVVNSPPAAVPKPVPQATAPLAVKHPPTFFSEEQLAKDFSAQMNTIATPAAHYILQVGVFKRQGEAQKFQRRLGAAGWQALIVATGKAQPLFRVQLGPYASVAQAKAVQQQLQQKNFVSLLRNNEKN